MGIALRDGTCQGAARADGSLSTGELGGEGICVGTSSAGHRSPCWSCCPQPGNRAEQGDSLRQTQPRALGIPMGTGTGQGQVGTLAPGPGRAGPLGAGDHHCCGVTA